MAKANPTKSHTIQPGEVYSLPDFMAVRRLGERTIRSARNELGTELQTLRVGRVKYVRGADGIDFIEKLAAANG